MSEEEIDPRDLAARLRAGESVFLVDVRQEWEHELVRLPGSVLAPLGDLPGLADDLAPPEGALVVAYCHHGVRSLTGVAILRQSGIEAYSLAGGIDAWAQLVDPSLKRY